MRYGLIATLGCMACNTVQNLGSDTVPSPPEMRELQLVTGAPGGNGATDGIGAAARLSSPAGLSADAAGHVFIADFENHLIRELWLASGAVTTLAGTPEVYGTADGVGQAAQFNRPTGTCIEGGNVYVADNGNRTLRKIDLATGQVTLVAGLPGVPGNIDGAGSAVRLNRPRALVGDGQGNLYFTDQFNHSIRKLVLTTGEVLTIAGNGQPGSADGLGQAAQFQFPSGIATDGKNLYVADQGNQTLRQITLADYTVSTVAGQVGKSGSSDGQGEVARFNNPIALAADKAGLLYIADYNNRAVRVLVLATHQVSTLAGSPEGEEVSAPFLQPYGIALDGQGHLLVTDFARHTVRQMALDSRQVSTIAGTAPSPGASNGTLVAARFRYPGPICADAAGALYVADNHAVRKIDPKQGQVSTVAGIIGMAGSQDGPLAVASFMTPIGMVCKGNHIYLSDFDAQTIRDIDLAAGQVTTLAGMAGTEGAADGLAETASFHGPTGLAVDEAGHLFVADQHNHTLRQITLSTRQVTTLVGMPGAKGLADGSGGSARFNAPRGLTYRKGILYVADALNRAVRRIEVASGAVSTISGELEAPTEVAPDAYGRLYVSSGDSTIRRIDLETLTVSRTVVGVPQVSGLQLGQLPGQLNHEGALAFFGDDLFIVQARENSVVVAREIARLK